MLLIYNTGILLYGLLIRLFALFNKKANLFNEGRKDLLTKIEQTINKNDQHIWFHFASLGEFEQGRTVLESCRKEYPQHKIVLTFFSPSGYEVRKNYAFADYIWYLPLDTPSNAKRFISIIQPTFSVFTKYDFWYHYFQAMHKKGIPLYVIAGTFRENQVFFKWYGALFRELLGCVRYFFLQDQKSADLLSKLGFKNIEVTGDTRFDRVVENSKNPTPNNIAAQFTANAKTIVCGSTWPPDEEILASVSVKLDELKFIIAPHEIGEERIRAIENKFKNTIRYSVANKQAEIELSDFKVLIIDNIGMLSSLYPYGDLAYVGGGFGTGLHNTQEPAAFGKSVIVGPDHEKFREVGAMISIGACLSIKSSDELLHILTHNTLNAVSGNEAKNYILSQSGATKQVMQYLINAHSRIGKAN